MRRRRTHLSVGHVDAAAHVVRFEHRSPSASSSASAMAPPALPAPTTTMRRTRSRGTRRSVPIASTFPRTRTARRTRRPASTARTPALQIASASSRSALTELRLGAFMPLLVRTLTGPGRLRRRPAELLPCRDSRERTAGEAYYSGVSKDRTVGMIDRLEILVSRLRRLVSRTRWSSRLLGHPAPPAHADTPGLVLIQVDGLGEKILKRALQAGDMPFLQAAGRAGASRDPLGLHRAPQQHARVPRRTLLRRAVRGPVVPLPRS